MNTALSKQEGRQARPGYARQECKQASKASKPPFPGADRWLMSAMVSVFPSLFFIFSVLLVLQASSRSPPPLS